MSGTRVVNKWVVIGRNTSVVTGINGATTSQPDASSPLYNLQGQRVSLPVKGQIYIQNGKKVLMK